MMKTQLLFPLLMTILLMAGCAGNPPQQDPVRSQAEVLQQLQNMQAQEQPTGQASVAPTVKKSIVPDINEPGQRGEIARKMLQRSSYLFLKADVDRDSLISAEEARQHIPHVGREFSRYDKNNDAGVSWQELLGHDKWPSPTPGSEGQ